MKVLTRREKFGTVLVVLLFIVAFVFWQCFFAAIEQPIISTLFWTSVSFSFVAVFFLLGAVVWSGIAWQMGSIFAMIFPSLLVVHTWQHVLFILFAAACLYRSLRSAQHEMRERMQFHFVHNARAGVFVFVVGIALMLSSAYFATIRTQPWEELVPRFRLGEGAATFVIKAVAYFYPDWKNLAQEGMTVDGFLMSIEMQNDPALMPSDEQKSKCAIPSDQIAAVSQGGSFDVGAYLQNTKCLGLGDQKQLSQKLALQAGREQIASLVGRPVRGDEKITDIFSVALQHKIVGILNGDQAARRISPEIVPVVLSILLFITLLTTGSLLGLLWLLLGWVLFRLIIVLRFVEIGQEEHSQQVLIP